MLNVKKKRNIITVKIINIAITQRNNQNVEVLRIKALNSHSVPSKHFQLDKPSCE